MHTGEENQGIALKYILEDDIFAGDVKRLW